MDFVKKIDNLKRQLMEMVDLIKADASRDSDDDESLDSKELGVLREAGIIPSIGKGKGSQKTRHIVFVDNDEEGLLCFHYSKCDMTNFTIIAQKLASREDKSLSQDPQTEEALPSIDLGWKTVSSKKRRKKEQVVSKPDDMDYKLDNDDIERDDIDEHNQTEHRSRTRLLKELSARLVRDTQLRYSQREFEMQRLMMGKGARKKISAVEKIEGDNEDEDEDEIDARKGRQRKSTRKVDEAMYKPRVYKWKLERKR